MFTGLVKCMGEVRSVLEVEGGRRFSLAGPLSGLQSGASVLHSGVCLSLVALEDTSGWSVDVAPETLRCTNLGRWEVGTPINLEPSLRLGDTLDGHLVFGHVDAVVEVLDIQAEGDSHRLRLELPQKLAPMLAYKGSVALEGVSLTVAHLDQDGFEIAIIPHTWQATNLRQCRVGDRLNLEIDMLARYVARMLEGKQTHNG